MIVIYIDHHYMSYQKTNEIQAINIDLSNISDSLIKKERMFIYHKKGDKSDIVYQLSLTGITNSESVSGEYRYYFGEIKSLNDLRFDCWPIDGGMWKISSYFGERVNPMTELNEQYHSGIDIASKKGTPVKAPAPGKVIQVFDVPKEFDFTAGYGSFIVIEHFDGSITTIYGHLGKILVNNGKFVKAGEIIGKVGVSGGATGPHLHFEVRKNNHPVDPMKYLE